MMEGVMSVKLHKVRSEFDVNKKYQKIIAERLYSSLGNYKRIYIVRFDLRFPVIIQDDCDDGITDYSIVKNNKVITRFFESMKSTLIAELKRRYTESMKKYNLKKIKQKPRRYKHGMSYVWVKEVGKESERKHYHVMIFFNRDCFYSCKPGGVLGSVINSAWNSALHLPKESKGLVNYCFLHNYQYLNLSDNEIDEKMEMLLDYSQYMTKVYTKAYDTKERSVGYSK